MVDDRIGADQQHHLRLHHVHHRIRHRARSYALEQGRHARRVAQPRAVIDVVGAEARAHQLLEQVRLFVGPLGGPEAGERAAAVRVADPRQRAARELERLFPARLAKYRERVCGIHREVGRFGHAGLPDQRLRQPLRMAHVVEAEAPLHAQALLIGQTVAALDADDRIVLDVVGELATDAAIRAHRRHLAVDRREIGVLRRRERARGTRLHAFAARHAGRLAHRVAQVEHDLRVPAAKRIADHVVDLHLAAGAHAARALDARVEIDRHRGMREVRRRLRARGEARLADGEPSPPVGKLGVRLVDAFGHVGHEHLDDDLLRVHGARGRARHFHSRRRRAAARRRQHALALDLHHARPAVAVRTHPRRVAQVGYLDAVALRGLDDRLARARGDVRAVQPEAHVIAARVDGPRPRGAHFNSSGKVADHAGDGVGRRLPEPADRRVGHRPRQFVEQRQIPCRLLEQPDRLLGADAARRALAARFVGKKPHQVERGVAGAVVLRQHDHGCGADERAVRLERVEIERHVAERRGQDPAGGAARKVGVELVARQHAAAVLVDQLPRRDAGRREMHAGLRDAARHRKGAQALPAVAPLPGEPRRRPFRGCRAPSRASPCCARASGARRARPARRTADAAGACRACLRSTRSSPTLRRRCRRRRRGANGCAAADRAVRPRARRSRASGSPGTRHIRRADRHRRRRCRRPTRRSACPRGNGAGRAPDSGDP